MLRFTPILIASIVSACAVATSSANKVVITDNKAVTEKCTKVANLDGSPSSVIVLRDPRRDAAIARLKAAAADMGATHVQTPLADIKWAGSDTSGVAYKCGTAG